MTQDIETLTQAAAAGDVGALEILLLEYHARLRDLVERRLSQSIRRSVSAEDVLQETYIRAFRFVDTFKPDGDDAFFRWMSTIAGHCVTDLARRRNAQKRGGGRDATESVVLLLNAMASRQDAPSRAAARREAVEAMQVALAGLSEDYRVVIELRYIEGLDVAATAKKMGRSTGSVQMLCHRALKRLEAAMGRASHYLSSKA